VGRAAGVVGAFDAGDQEVARAGVELGGAAVPSVSVEGLREAKGAAYNFCGGVPIVMSPKYCSNISFLPKSESITDLPADPCR
jgi:hypothetical protein